MDSTVLEMFFVIAASIFHRNLGLAYSLDFTTTGTCYELTIGQRFLQPSSAVDPNGNYWQFATLTRNGTAPTASWKLIPTPNSCFRLCHPLTGLQLMVAENDLTYTVPRSLMERFPRESFIFGPYYPRWPTTLDALITNTLKGHQLCLSLDEDPNEDKLVDAYPQQKAAAYPAQCHWRLNAVNCPRPDCC